MKTIERKDYLKKLYSLKDQRLIKVITGVRRCGKSTLLKIFRDKLRDNDGITEDRLQMINFEDPKYSYEVNWHDIYNMIEVNLAPDKMNYVFLDEVQYVDNFEKLLIGLQTKENIDLYVTGSNAHMLSSELATLLSGRSIEISMLPLSFKEYIEARNEKDASYDTLFGDYLSYGGFPQAVELMGVNLESVDTYLSSIYETVVGRDIMDRGEVSDKATLNKVVRFLLDNIGNSTSTNSLAEAIGVSRYKIEQMVNALKDSFLFYELNRFDVKGKEMLKTQEKYYTVDMGLRWAMLGRDAATDMGHLLENIVFLELKRRGGKVLIGKVDNKEVDFVVKDHNGKTLYYQVAWSVNETKTLERELEPLEKIDDYNARFLITMDKVEMAHNGIQQINAIKWLTEKE